MDFGFVKGENEIFWEMKNEALLAQYEASFGYEAKRTDKKSFFMMRSIASCAEHASWAARRASLKKSACDASGFFLVGEDGFEPSKRNAADLQSVPFGHSGTPPDIQLARMEPVDGLEPPTY